MISLTVDTSQIENGFSAFGLRASRVENDVAGMAMKASRVESGATGFGLGASQSGNGPARFVVMALRQEGRVVALSVGVMRRREGADRIQEAKG